MSAVAEIFDHNGILAENLQGFRFRDAQQQMAKLVWESIETGGHLVIEAGTGIGKTYAYLIPVLLSGRRAIVSTGTKTLQDQLFFRDLPALGAAIGRPATVAVLKGRANYLCWHRLELALAESARDSEVRRLYVELAAFGRASDSGDLDRMPELGLDARTRARATSTIDNCLGGKCPEFGRCFVASARKTAQDAQIVIVNHHLLLADIALKEAGFGEFLGTANTVVVDEAHLLPDVAQQFFGESVSSREPEILIGDIRSEFRGEKLGDDLATELSGLAGKSAALRDAARRLDGRQPWRAMPAGVRESFAGIVTGLNRVNSLLQQHSSSIPGLTRCAERAGSLGQRLDAIVNEGLPDGLKWFDASRRALSLHWTPFEVGESLNRSIEDQGGNWIFTSATLAVGDSLEHYVSRIGIDDAVTEVLPSPFDYEDNARYYFPEGLPDPGHEEYTESVMSHVWPLIEASGGGAFILFTSYRALHAAQSWLHLRRTPGPLLVQGMAARAKLLDEFRESNSAVLLGTSSFWQGVDVRGDALRIVVIDKLPFAAPNDPIIEARSRAIRARGGDPFVELQLPQAVLALKQGVGRLIRDYQDRGLIVICDPRLRTRGYGRLFLESLPVAPVLDEFDAAMEYAAELRTKREIEE